MRGENGGFFTRINITLDIARLRPLAQKQCLKLGHVLMVHPLLRFLLRRSPPPIVAEGHGAQSRFGNPEAAFAQ
jgi:hypothetical protein